MPPFFIPLASEDRYARDLQGTMRVAALAFAAGPRGAKRIVLDRKNTLVIASAID